MLSHFSRFSSPSGNPVKSCHNSEVTYEQLHITYSLKFKPVNKLTDLFLFTSKFLYLLSATLPSIRGRILFNISGKVQERS